MKAVIRTEVWNTGKGRVARAVVRNTDGTFIGVSNQTATVKVARTVRPRVTLVAGK